MEENNNLQNGVQEPVTPQAVNNPEVISGVQNQTTPQVVNETVIPQQVNYSVASGAVVDSINTVTNTETVSDNTVNAKEKKPDSILSFVGHMAGSFIVWNFITLTIFNSVVQSILLKFFSDNVTMAIVGYNVLWTVTSAIAVFLTYFFNRKKVLEEKNYKLTKGIMLGIFNLLIMLINYRNMLTHLEYGFVITVVMILLHACVIWFLNCILHEKYFNSAKLGKFDFISLGVAIVVIFVVLLVSNITLNKKYTLNCVRGNGDNVVIKFDTDGIKSVSVNDKELESDELMLYRLKFIGKFAMAQIGNDDVDHLVDEYMEIVSNYEENDEEYKSTCSYK